MEIDIQDEINRDGIIFYSVLYSSVTVVFAMAVLSRFLTNEFRFGFRSFLSLVTLFLGEPLCQFLVRGPGGLVLFSFGCLVVYYILPASHLPVENKTVLITGCDSGFGHALALKLDNAGMRVFAGCLEIASPGAVELKNNSSDRLCVLKLDVTDIKSITAVSEYVRDEVGESGLWGLVNNAGVWCFAELEMTSDEVVKKVMDVNLFGSVRMTKSVLGLIKKAHGRIINVSSLLGRVSLEGNGAYSMSKHALVAYTNTLRLEMKKWDVSVSIVEPTGFLTGNMQEHVLQRTKEEVWSTLDKETQEIYGRDYFDAIYTHIRTCSQRYPTDLTPVTRCLFSGLLSKRPRARYPCGTGAEFLLCLYPLLPVWMADLVSNSISLIPRQLRPHVLCSNL